MLNLLQYARLAFGTTIKVDLSFFLLVACINAVSYSMIRSTEDDVDEVDIEFILCKGAPIVSTEVSSTISSEVAAKDADEQIATVDLEDPPRHVP